jgi:Tol biopolymer transport system component
MTTLSISTIAAVLGLIALALLFYKRLRRYKIGLLLGALLMFALAVGAYLAAPPRGDLRGSSAVTKPPAKDASAPTQRGEQVPVSPISPVAPVSPISSVEPTTLVAGNTSDLQLEGCLLFVSNRSGDSEIYKWQAGMDNLERLTNSPGFDIEPDWSPDGTQIAFATNRETDAGFQMYVMNADGSNQARLGEIQPGDNSHASWSADGEQLVFQSKRDTNANPQDDKFDIYTMNSDGSNISIVVAHPADDTEPSWSPDGRKIAFLSERSGQDEVYLVDTDGANLEQVTELPGLKSGLSWSDDGRSLIFEGNGDIYRVNIETKQVSKLIAVQDVNEATPAWAGNDKFVVLSSDRSQNWELYAVDVSSPDQFLLYQLTDDPGIDRSPAWFPCSQE